MRVILLSFLILFSGISSVSAHVLNTSDSIGGILHVDPADDPIAGELSTFYISLKDKEGKFKAENCNCQVTIEQEGQSVFKDQAQGTDLAASGESNLTFSYTFPTTTIYKIIIDGEPKIADQFAPFTLTYDVRVARDSASKTSSKQLPQAAWIGLGLLACIGVGLAISFNKKSKIG